MFIKHLKCHLKVSFYDESLSPSLERFRKQDGYHCIFSLLALHANFLLLSILNVKSVTDLVVIWEKKGRQSILISFVKPRRFDCIKWIAFQQAHRLELDFVGLCSGKLALTKPFIHSHPRHNNTSKARSIFSLKVEEKLARNTVCIQN